MDEDAALARLEARLGHTFANRELLRTALTHRSWANEHGHGGSPRAYNERLEFLGDSLLGAAAAALLFERFPEAREGEMTRRRADLVCERSFARIAADLELGPLLRLGRGEDRTGGREKPRLLASAFEACIAAVLLDAGTERATTVARSLLETVVALFEPGALDYKSRLQEREQGAAHGSPRYELLASEGPEHARTFRVVVRDTTGRALAEGEGRSKLEAEQSAARAALGEPERVAMDAGSEA